MFLFRLVLVPALIPVLALISVLSFLVVLALVFPALMEYLLYAPVLLVLLETAVQAMGFSAFRDAAVYIVLIVILLVLPGGLFGTKQVEKV